MQLFTSANPRGVRGTKLTPPNSCPDNSSSLSPCLHVQTPCGPAWQPSLIRSCRWQGVVPSTYVRVSVSCPTIERSFISYKTPWTTLFTQEDQTYSSGPPPQPLDGPDQLEALKLLAENKLQALRKHYHRPQAARGVTPGASTTDLRKCRNCVYFYSLVYFHAPTSTQHMAEFLPYNRCSINSC